MAQEGKAYIHLALAIHYAGGKVDEETMKKAAEAIGLEIDEAKIKMLVASLEEVNLEEVLKQAVAAPAAAVAAAPAAAPAAEEKAEEEKKEEEEEKKEEEVDLSGLSGMFGF
ncbi:MAG: 50S ribosomal protein P1 [Aeropyrum sp.]|nr:50S ribosomal protein P1 [Aeropyrum sp.]MCE4616113.1 50S ribosomal protein P1 [Aeropyrum sp.]